VLTFVLSNACGFVLVYEWVVMVWDSKTKAREAFEHEMETKSQT
jgi:hypothetical protein